MTADVLDRTDEDTTTGTTEDTPTHRHYFSKRDLQDTVPTGKTIVALCGYKHRPNQDGATLPICPTCKAIWETKK